MKLPNYRYLAGLCAIVIGAVAIFLMPPTQQDIAGWLLSITMQMATPLVLAGLGGMYSERGGIVNIGLEGMMLMGAFTGAAVTWYLRDPLLGVIAACAAGGLLAAVHGVICVKFKGNQIVSGTGIILFGSGFTTIMLELVWHQKGRGDLIVNTIPDITIPQIQDVPFFGPAFSAISPIVIFMFLITAISWYVLYRTPFGLRLRAAGEDPSTLDSAGASVEWTRVIGVIISGCLAGLGGAYLSIGFSSAFAKDMTNGRGFIALAAMIFGNWTPTGILGAGLFFGFLDGLKYFIQIYFPTLLPFANFIAMLPFVLVVVALGLIRKSIPPKAVGTAYEKEKKG
ncbi:MAG: ABC transporter permease [Candidatus Thorarchaeota archaeon]|nr:MAG: ABC transporter permease [Candidatus Thorarchaeota archaeon]